MTQTLRDWNCIHGTQASRLWPQLSAVGGGILQSSPIAEPYVSPTLNFDEDEDDDQDDDDYEDEDEEEEDEDEPTDNMRPGTVRPYVSPVLNFRKRSSKGSGRTRGQARTNGVAAYVPPAINWRTGEIG